MQRHGAVSTYCLPCHRSSVSGGQCAAMTTALVLPLWPTWEDVVRDYRAIPQHFPYHFLYSLSFLHICKYMSKSTRTLLDITALTFNYWNSSQYSFRYSATFNPAGMHTRPKSSNISLRCSSFRHAFGFFAQNQVQLECCRNPRRVIFSSLSPKNEKKKNQAIPEEW